jgi:hypothetical protein
MSRPSLLAVFLLALATAGCGSQYDLHPVTGKVTLDGNPLENAVVTFQSVSGGTSASGTTDASGVYSLHDIRPDGGPGAEPGEYVVSVSWTEPPAVDLSQMDASSPDYDKITTAASNPNSGPVASKFPAAYRSGKTSGLKATVSPGANTVDLPLESSFKGAR